eukprot:317343_1
MASKTLKSSHDPDPFKSGQGRIQNMIKNVKQQQSKIGNLRFCDIKNKGKTSTFNDDLVYGYIRIHYERNNMIMPVDIIKIIIFYGQDGIVWTLTKQEVMSFPSASHYNPLCSASTLIQKAEFNYFLKPGLYRRHSMQFGIQSVVGSIPNNIEYIELYCELRCVEANNNFKGVAKFGPFLPKDSLSFIAFSWNENTLQNYNQLTFVGIIDVLCVKYKQNNRLNNDPRTMNLTKIRRRSEFKWKIPTEQLNAHSLYSSNFNHDAFALWTKGKYEIGIKLLRVPPRIKKMDIEYCFKINDKMYQRSAIILCGWTKSFKPFGDRNADYRVKLVKVERMEMECVIKVMDVFDYHDKRIPQDRWTEYGIL